MTKKKGFALRDFKDAGTEETFEGGKVHDFDPGAYTNFEVAGLVRKPTDKEAKGDQSSSTTGADTATK